MHVSHSQMSSAGDNEEVCALLAIKFKRILSIATIDGQYLVDGDYFTAVETDGVSSTRKRDGIVAARCSDSIAQPSSRALVRRAVDQNLSREHLVRDNTPNRQ